jgi:hypothetical protein
MQIEFHKVTSKRDYNHRFLCVYFFKARPPLTNAGPERIFRKPLHRLLGRSQHLSPSAKSFPSINPPFSSPYFSRQYPRLNQNFKAYKTHHEVIDAVPTAPPKKTLAIMKSRFITKVFTLFLAVRIDAIITKYVNILAEHLNARGEIQTEVVL